MMQRIKAACRKAYFPAYHHSGTRPAASIRHVVWHDTEGGTAASNARYFQSSSSGGSAHIVVDNKECQRCLDDSQVPWGAPGFNTSGLHIEQAAYASWRKPRWLLHSVMLHRTAYKTARWCKRYHIPIRFLTGEHIASTYPNVPPGITTHVEITRSGKYGDTHTDPGAGYPRRYVMGLVRVYRALLVGRAA
jgi:hypothetical protein